MKMKLAAFMVVVCIAATVHAQDPSAGSGQAKTADEIARELANPATPMSSLGNNFPTISYDWEADTGQAWTIPLGVGVVRTFIAGKTPIKSQLQLFYNVEQPDAFAQEWGIKLSFSPVV